MGDRTAADWERLADVLTGMTANARRVALGAVAEAPGEDPRVAVDAALRRETEGLVAGTGSADEVTRRAVVVVDGMLRDMSDRALSGTPTDPAAAIIAAFDALDAWLEAGGRSKIIAAGVAVAEGDRA